MWVLSLRTSVGVPFTDTLDTDLPPFVAGKRQRVVSVVGDVAGVVGAVASVIEAVANVDEEVIDADWICASSMVVLVKLLRPVVQMI